MSSPLDHGIPVIRLTLDGMRAQVLNALTGYESDLAEATRREVEKFCTPANLDRIIGAEVGRVIEHAIEEEVRTFYRSGPGRAVIRDLVNMRLGDND